MLLYFLIKKSLNVIKKRYKALEIKIVFKRKLVSKFLTIKKYGVITGFVHPDGLDTTSYYCGYNGTDLIQCVQIDKNNLTRCRDNQRNIKKFTAHKKRLRICEVDLWNEKGVNIK